MYKQLKLIDGTSYEIQTDAPEINNHFSNGSNCTNEILHQFNTNYYEKFITKEDKIFLDLGANIGLFALHVTPWAEQIVCIEPTPSHFKLLTQLTGKFKSILRVQAAISNKTGTSTFYASPSNSTTNSLFDHHRGNSFVVETFNMPDLISNLNINHFDFIKMDIEGGEVIVLTNETIEYISKIASKILIEFHPCAGKHQTAHRDHYAALFDDYFYIEKFGCDGLFCKKDRKKLERNKVFAKIKEKKSKRDNLFAKIEAK